jgi:hypothetical protein
MRRRLQIGTCFQCSRNLVSYEFICQARTRVNFVIGEWQQAHNLVHSQSVQPGFILRHSGDTAPYSAQTNPMAGCGAAVDDVPAMPSSAQASGATAALAAAQASQVLC